MRKAQAAIADGKWNDALELLQRIAALPEDTLYRLDGSNVNRAVGSRCMTKCSG